MKSLWSRTSWWFLSITQIIQGLCCSSARELLREQCTDPPKSRCPVPNVSTQSKRINRNNDAAQGQRSQELLLLSNPSRSNSPNHAIPDTRPLNCRDRPVVSLSEIFASVFAAARTEVICWQWWWIVDDDGDLQVSQYSYQQGGFLEEFKCEALWKAPFEIEVYSCREHLLHPVAKGSSTRRLEIPSPGDRTALSLLCLFKCILYWVYSLKLPQMQWSCCQ